jgi:hypothetical protein
MMNLTTTRKKLNGWALLLSARHKSIGRSWYRDARLFAEELARTYGPDLSIEKCVGVIACLSPQNRWDANKRDAEDLISAWHQGLPPEDVSVATYDGQKRKAIAILRSPKGTDPRSMIGTKYAPKTQAFYDNILRPETSYRVTIDRWIFRGLGLDLFSSGGGNRYVAVYRHLEELFRQVALAEGLQPCELQAAIWVLIQETADAEEWDGSRPTHKAPVPEGDTPF